MKKEAPSAVTATKMTSLVFISCFHHACYKNKIQGEKNPPHSDILFTATCGIHLFYEHQLEVW